MENTHIQYGGVRFTNNVSPEEINQFVRNLPSEQKDSLFEVVKLLSKHELITLHEGEHSTVDETMQRFMTPNGGDGQ